MGRRKSDGTDKGYTAHGGKQGAEEPVSLALWKMRQREGMRLQAVEMPTLARLVLYPMAGDTGGLWVRITIL